MRTRWSPDRTVERQKAGKFGEVGEVGTVREAREAREADDEAHGERPQKVGLQKPRKRTGIRRFVTWRKALVGVLCLCVLPAGGFTFLYVTIDIPKANEPAKAQSNVYLYSDGSRLARTGEINRESVPLSRVPEDVRNAFVAAENKDFYSDSGVSLSGTARGIVSTVTGQGKQGGSTITQQYVKNYYLSQEQTISRKVKELVISLKVDRHNSKDDILAGYLNSSYYGRLAYVIQAAARAYYDRDVEDLTVEQGAYLAALLQAPSQYDWAVAGPAGKRLVQQRWAYVLDNMVDEGQLDKGERQQMRFPEPVAPKPAAGLAGQAGYLVDAARRELMASGSASGNWRAVAGGSPSISSRTSSGPWSARSRRVSAPATGRPERSRSIRGPAGFWRCTAAATTSSTTSTTRPVPITRPDPPSSRSYSPPRLRPEKRTTGRSASNRSGRPPQTSGCNPPRAASLRRRRSRWA